MHPGEQVRIAGGIRPAVAADAVDPQVNGFDFGDQPFGLGGGAKGGDGDKLAGAAQAAEHIVAEIGMIPDASQRQRVQHLQQ
ncbi:hypothetical protein D3C80_1322320 [compost metagenome]